RESSCGYDPRETRSYNTTLTVAHFVARQHWLRSCTAPHRFSAHPVPRGAPLGCVLLPISTLFALLPTPIHRAAEWRAQGPHMTGPPRVQKVGHTPICGASPALL